MRHAASSKEQPMDANRFDAFARGLDDLSSRRTMLGLALTGGLGGLSSLFDAEAKKHHQKKKKHKKKRCGPCTGGTCDDGACVCPAQVVPCGPGLCCANEQVCSGGECGSCPLSVTPCDNTLCGKTPGNKPCFCATTLEGEAACILGDLGTIKCFDCDTDADCESELDLPAGATVCIGGLTCQGGCSGTGGKACAINHCADA
jgi:hypothetical protein